MAARSHFERGGTDPASNGPSRRPHGRYHDRMLISINPAQAWIHFASAATRPRTSKWIPACAGMTDRCTEMTS
jgi:hypothetical protein